MATPFTGFTSATHYTSMPNPLLGPLLEEIQELTELKVILRGMWLLHRNRSLPRRVSLEEFLSDQTLLRGFKNYRNGPKSAIIRGLGLAVERGIFLVYPANPDSADRVFYLLNTETDRRALAKLTRDCSPMLNGAKEDVLIPTGNPAPERPNIFALYEENVGMISPMIAEELKEAEELYSWNWLSEAFRIAVTQNHRSWGYIASILRRWAAEGRGWDGSGSGSLPRREVREDGEPGRHTAKGNRQKFLEDYQRRWSEASDKPTRN